MPLDAMLLRDAIQNVMDDRDPAVTWYWVNHAVRIACPGLELLIPVDRRTGFQAPPVGAVSGPDAAERLCLELPGGPGLDAQYHLLSDRVAHIHAFVLSAR